MFFVVEWKCLFLDSLVVSGIVCYLVNMSSECVELGDNTSYNHIKWKWPFLYTWQTPLLVIVI